MSRISPRLVTARRWELNEKRVQLTGLMNLRTEFEEQLQLLTRANDLASGDRCRRLGESIALVDDQIEAAEQEIGDYMRALRLLERPPGSHRRKSERDLRSV